MEHHVHKAGSSRAEGVTLHIHRTVRQFPMSNESIEEDMRTVLKAIRHHLPGCVYEALLKVMVIVEERGLVNEEPAIREVMDERRRLW